MTTCLVDLEVNGLRYVFKYNLPCLVESSFKVDLGNIAADLTIDLEFVASQRCEDVMLDSQALHHPVIVSIIDIFENHSTHE